jgi:hypothetical protein
VRRTLDAIRGGLLLVAAFAASPIAHARTVDATTGSIAGKVTSAGDGTPIGGAKVFVYWSFFYDHVIEATTDSLGNYQVDGLDPGFTYLTVVDAGGYNLIQAWPGKDCFPKVRSAFWIDCPGQDVSVVANQTTSGIDFPLNAGAIVEGHLTRTDTNAPVAGATIDQAAKPSDATGFYRIESIPAGFITFIVNADGYVRTLNDGQQFDAFQTLVLTSPPTVEAGQTSTIDIAIEPAVSFTGTVRSGGIPIPSYVLNYHARLYNEDDPNRSYVEILLDNYLGTFRQDGLIARNYTVRFGDPDDTRYVSEYYDNVTCAQDPCDPGDVTRFATVPGQNIKLDADVASRQRVKGRIVDATSNTPIANADVSAQAIHSLGPLGSVWQVEADSRSDAQGRFVLTGIPAASPFALRVIATGHVGVQTPDVVCDQYNGFCAYAPTTQASLQVDLDQVLDLGDIALQPGPTISGRVVNSLTGTPLGGALVDLLAGSDVALGVLTDDDGRYETPGLNAGSLKALVSTSAYTLMYDQVSCGDDNCALSLATPIAVSTANIGGIDFNVAEPDAVFSAGFGY